MKIGSHVSNNGSKMLIGSVEEILSYGGNCLMVYLGAPQNTFRKPIENQNAPQAIALAKEFGINGEDIIVHAPYIVNLAQMDDDKFNFAISFSFLPKVFTSYYYYITIFKKCNCFL